MKKQNLLFIPFVLFAGIAAFSCSVGNTGNISNFPSAPAVVDTYMGETVCGTLWGYVAAPSLTDVSAGDCIFMQYVIDYDNQPSNPTTPYMTASGIDKTSVNQSPATINTNSEDAAELGDYTLPISNAGVFDFSQYGLSNANSAFFNGKYFVQIICQDNYPSFRLVYNIKEPEINGVKNLYLQAKPSSLTGNVTDSVKIYAFDLSSILQQFSRDTTILGTSFKYIKVNLNYFNGMSGDTIVYKVSNSSSNQDVYIFNK